MTYEYPSVELAAKRLILVQFLVNLSVISVTTAQTQLGFLSRIDLECTAGMELFWGEDYLSDWGG